MALGTDDGQTAHFLDTLPQHDIGTAAGHVGSYGDRTELACLRDYLRFLLMVLCVEHIVLYTALFKQI